MDSANSSKEIASWIQELPEFIRELRKQELRKHGASFVAGWRLLCSLSESVEIDFLVSRDSPYSPPKIAVADRDKFGVWPHIDKDGILCVFPETADVDPYNPVEVAATLFAETKELLQALLDGSLDADFHYEFDAYWAIGADKTRYEFYSILEVDTPSGEISVWRSKSLRVIGTTHDSVERWLQNRFQRELHRAEIGYLIRLDSPMQPKDFPNNSSALFELVRVNAPDYVEAISERLVSSMSPLIVVLASEALNGTDYGVVELCRVLKPGEKVSRRGKSNRYQVNGFRDGKTPLAVQVASQVKSTVTTRASLQRADAQWARGGRGHDPRFDVLQKLSVAFIGVGSLGSVIAETLVQAGLGALSMYDGEVLRWENTGRHLLGGEFVGDFKTEGMRTHLLRNYPTISQCDSHPNDWAKVITDARSLEQFDLIVSTTGSWRAEARLNDLHVRTGRKIPIVYAWLEPFAAAGHAVAILKDDACLQCGFTRAGKFYRQVFDWPSTDSTLISQAGCGSEFQPYGVTDSFHSVAMTINLCVEVLLGATTESTHRMWVNKDRGVDTVKRQWASDWQSQPIEEFIETVSEFPWPRFQKCLRCSN